MTNPTTNIETLSDADCNAVDGGIDFVKSWDFTGTVGGAHLGATTADPIDVPFRGLGLLGQAFHSDWHR